MFSQSHNEVSTNFRWIRTRPSVNKNIFKPVCTFPSSWCFAGDCSFFAVIIDSSMCLFSVSRQLSLSDPLALVFYCRFGLSCRNTCRIKFHTPEGALSEVREHPPTIKINVISELSPCAKCYPLFPCMKHWLVNNANGIFMNIRSNLLVSMLGLHLMHL